MARGRGEAALRQSRGGGGAGGLGGVRGGAAEQAGSLLAQPGQRLAGAEADPPHGIAEHFLEVRPEPRQMDTSGSLRGGGADFPGAAGEAALNGGLRGGVGEVGERAQVARQDGIVGPRGQRQRRDHRHQRIVARRRQRLDRRCLGAGGDAVVEDEAAYLLRPPRRDILEQSRDEQRILGGADAEPVDQLAGGRRPSEGGEGEGGAQPDIGAAVAERGGQPLDRRLVGELGERFCGGEADSGRSAAELVAQPLGNAEPGRGLDEALAIAAADELDQLDEQDCEEVVAALRASVLRRARPSRIWISRAALASRPRPFQPSTKRATMRPSMMKRAAHGDRERRQPQQIEGSSKTQTHADRPCSRSAPLSRFSWASGESGPAVPGRDVDRAPAHRLKLCSRVDDAFADVGSVAAPANRRNPLAPITSPRASSRHVARPILV
jgi:hypothetical protein